MAAGNVERVAIVGAGLGGLATAIALRARGIEATVYERTHELRHAGIGLTLHPNGLRTLDALEPGLAGEIVAQGAPSRSVTFHDTQANVLMRMPIELEARYGYPQLLVRWSLVQTALAKRLPAEALQLGHALEGWDDGARHVTARFANGASVDADLLIACDGVHSRVRTWMHGDDARFLGRNSYRGFVRAARDDLPVECSHFYVSRQGETALISDVGQGTRFWNLTIVGALESPERAAADIRPELLARIPDWKGPLRDVIAATADTEMLVRPVYDRLPITSWHRGRVLLLADAAHAMSPSFGQGANAAFEDAFLLARCLTERASLEDALCRLEALRVERTQAFQAKNQEFGENMHASQNARFLESVDAKLKLDPAAFNDWMVSYDVEAVEV